MATCLIVGATRGIGRELARQYAADGWRVLATHRDAADGAVLASMGALALAADVCAEGWAPALVRAIGPETVDLAVIVAGISGPDTEQPVDPGRAQFDQVMHTNVLAAMQLIPALSGLLVAARGKLAVISSRMGSIGGTTSPSWWLYRASKAALNSVLKSASVTLGAQGVVCMSLHPGWVRTAMGGPDADLSVEECAASLRRVMAAANRSHNGRFLNFNGEQLEW